MMLTLLILITSFLLNLFLPWWSIALPGLVLGYYYNKKALESFGWGFMALFILWSGQALYIHFANEAILSTRIAEMLQIGSPILVIIITGVLGGLVSGLATVCGTYISDLRLPGETVVKG